MNEYRQFRLWKKPVHKNFSFLFLASFCSIVLQKKTEWATGQDTYSHTRSQGQYQFSRFISRHGVSEWVSEWVKSEESGRLWFRPITNQYRDCSSPCSAQLSSAQLLGRSAGGSAGPSVGPAVAFASNPPTSIGIMYIHTSGIRPSVPTYAYARWLSPVESNEMMMRRMRRRRRIFLSHFHSIMCILYLLGTKY